jgi:NAD(P)H-flavin reductase/ferredoxin
MTISSTDLGAVKSITVQAKTGEFTFDCAERETILHAGLRSGLNLPYECASGTCGTCRARVTGGNVEVRWKEAPGAARLKPEKGDILMCQTQALSDCVLRVPSEIGVSERPLPTHRHAEIEEVRILTCDVAHFDLLLSEPMRFEAGQFVLVETSALAGGRAYSMTNFDDFPDKLGLLLKRKPGGKFSDWFFANLQRNMKVHVFGPLGRAVFRPQEDKDIVCIAGGSGIAGMMAILDRAYQVDYFRTHRGRVFFGVRTLADAFFLGPLSRHVVASQGNLAVIVALSDEAAMTLRHRDYPEILLTTGMVHEAATKDMEEIYRNAIVYVAGPPIMVNAAMRALILGGVALGNIRYDKFG